jgi:hypothetical protein
MMKIPALDAYSNPYVNRADEAAQVSSLLEKTGKKIISIPQDQSTRNGNDINKELLSRKERDFFIGLFPDNTEKISNHVLFTRNGKIQQQPIVKGLIVDSKV